MTGQVIGLLYYCDKLPEDLVSCLFTSRRIGCIMEWCDTDMQMGLNGELLPGNLIPAEKLMEQNWVEVILE